MRAHIFQTKMMEFISKIAKRHFNFCMSKSKKT